jgi:hypothetical protein
MINKNMPDGVSAIGLILDNIVLFLETSAFRVLGETRN